MAIKQVLGGERYITPLLEEAFAAVDPANLIDRSVAPEIAKHAVADPPTTRQREVLQLIAKGHTNKSIATELNISVKTVEYQKDIMMTTLGIRTTAKLTRYAVAEGVVNG